MNAEKQHYMKRIIPILAAVAVLFAGGCSREKIERKVAEKVAEKINVESLESISGDSDGWAVKLLVRNDTSRDIGLQAASADVFFNGEKAASLKLAEAVVLPKRYHGTVEVKVKLKIVSPFTAYRMWDSLRKGSYDGTEVSFAATAAAGDRQKEIGAERMPLKELMDKVGYKK